MKYYPLINRHAAWLVANPIQGCPNNCKYCFLQSVGGTKVKPEILASPEETLIALKKSHFYVNDVPVCFFSQTDIGATPINIQYWNELLDLLSGEHIHNPIVFITKCKIPLDIINKLSSLIQNGLKIIVYLSYSGLDDSIEGGIRHIEIEKNFILLKKYGIPVVHYFRPIIPQNAEEKKQEEIISFVSTYAMASVVAGLKVAPDFQEFLNFWPEVQNDPEANKAECVWPDGAKAKLHRLAKKYNHPLFEVNSCALAHVLNEPERYGFCASSSCNDFSICSDEIKRKCYLDKEKNRLQIDEIKNKMDSLLTAIYKPINQYSLRLGNNILLVESLPLTTEEICYLSGEIHMRIESKLIENGNYWNTSVNNKKGVNK